MSGPSAASQEETKKRIAYIAFGVVFIGIAIYAYEAFFSSSPAAVVPPATATAARPTGSTNGTPLPATQKTAQQVNGNQPAGANVAPGVAATRMASTSSSLDPTLDQTAMLRTESLVYAGSGRNIFSLTYVAAPVEVKNVPPPRPTVPVPAAPVAPAGPPPPPPINLKFFGTETSAGGRKQAFLLQGDDVYLAAQGDIVARKYKIVSISTSSIQVEDLVNHNTQTLPLATN